MIRMIQSTSSKQAKRYFSEELGRSDYYVNDQELPGVFKGKLAARLGIEGPASKEAFFHLAENKHPITGNPLTPRTKDNRIVGYDVNFHAPKSLSILQGLGHDPRLLEAFQVSVDATMKEIEKAALVRVRKGKVYEDRKSGEIVYADFVHQTARPVGDLLPDPHLHAHCFLFNCSWDATEKSFKAGKFREIKRNMPWYQKQFHKRLADEVVKLGYRVRPTKNSFEIEGVSEAVIRHFSKRTDEIGRVAKEKGITDKETLANLGAKTRGKKQKGHSMDELRIKWKQEIDALTRPEPVQEKPEAKENQPIPELPKPEPKKQDQDKTPADINSAQDCVAFAIKHCFERASVVSDKELLLVAYGQALGKAHIGIEAIDQAFYNDKSLLLFPRGAKTLCTTKEALSEERRMVTLARRGMGKTAPLYNRPQVLEGLSEEQNRAVNHVLTTQNRVSIVMGAAGTGKTKLMDTARLLIEQAGKKVIAVAPTALAARGVLRGDGFKDAETVAKLLTDPELQKKLKNQVLWVDEAGLLGTKDMVALLELAEKQKARVVLGGDTRQHSSVVRGDALRIINTVGGIKAAEVKTIRRQNKEVYRSLVQDLSQGKVVEAFDKLEQMNAIKEVKPDQPSEQLVEDYINVVKQKKSALVISPTHKLGKEVTAELRKRLKALGKIGRKDKTLQQFSNMNLTEAEKSDWRNYELGQLVQFNQNTKEVKRGSKWIVQESKDEKVILRGEDGQSVQLPLIHGKRFDVFQVSQIELSKGDSVRITRNGWDQQRKRLDNGMTLNIKKINKDGTMITETPEGKSRFVIPKDYGHINHAYCVTSHASQGKTVDEVFIAQPAATFGATDLKQFYVSVSRGREAVHIYTDDKTGLFENAAEMGDRYSAIELVAGKNSNTRDHLRLQQLNAYLPKNKLKNKAKETSFIRNTIDIEHEPRI